MDRSLKAAGRSFSNKKKVIKNKKKDNLKTTDSTK
jgi:hypothetical protein